MLLKDYLAKHAKRAARDSGGLLHLIPRIVCADGFSISIQGGFHAYCTPRINGAAWTNLEAGYPSSRPGDALLHYADDASSATESIYPYVPIDVLQAELDAHGGIKGEAND